MSSISNIAIPIFSLLTSSAISSSAQPLTLVKDGLSQYVIVISAEASPSEKRGAEELQRFLKEMSGAELSVVVEPPSNPQFAIFVGKSESLIREHGRAPLIGELEDEGFLLKTAGAHILIVGDRLRGTMYGVYTFLEKLGCRWFTAKVSRIPQQKTIVVAPMEEFQKPAFEYREPFFTEAFDKDWAARNKVNSANAYLDESTGGKITYHHFVHTFDTLIPQSLYDTHSEYFPLIDGKRTGGYVQRCLTHPEVLRLTIEKVKEWIRERPEAHIYSVSQNDTGKWCECDSCKKITKKYKAHSGLYLWFVNQVAEAIEKEHPDKLIDTLAYQFTEEPPEGIVPRKNVRVRLCPISCCEAHPYEQCTYPANVAYVKNLKAWAKITDTLYIWHYNTNFRNYLLPFPDFNELPADTRMYKRLSVKGIFFQGAYAPGGGGSDAELRSYVLAKLLWEPNVDSDALVTEFMQGVYGKAWQPLRQWFDLIHEKVRDPDLHFRIFDPPTVGYLTPEIISEGDRLFDEAERLAADDAMALSYVRKARLSLRYVQIVRSEPSAAAIEKLKAFLSDVRSYGITSIREGQPLDAFEQQQMERIK